MSRKSESPQKAAMRNFIKPFQPDCPTAMRAPDTYYRPPLHGGDYIADPLFRHSGHLTLHIWILP